MRIIILADGAAQARLEPLMRAYVVAGISPEFHTTAGAVPDGATLRALAEAADALLVVGDRRRSPRTVLPGPVIARANGRPIAVGWLPDTGPEALTRFARAAARAQTRERSTVSIAVLGQWNPRYLRLAGRIEQILKNPSGDIAVFRWTSDLLLRESLVDGLGAGLGAAVYVGHGRPIGWVGYRGTRAHHFDSPRPEPLGAMLSLCCLTASRRRTGLSFAEALPLQGVSAASLGAVNSTLHTDNTRWAVRLCLALSDGAQTLADLITAALPATESGARSYRLVGDPLAPLAGPSAGVRRAERIEVFP